MAAIQPTVDAAMNKSVYMNGEKLGGVTVCSIAWDMDKIVTKVTLECCVKKDSLIITENTISFHTPGHKDGNS